MAPTLVDSLNTLTIIFSIITLFTMLISVWEDNKIYAATRIAIGCLTVILCVLSGIKLFAALWATTTLWSLYKLAMMNGNESA